MFSWCQGGDHDGCKREYQRFYIDHKNKLVWMDEWRYCECTKRGCECYVPAKDRGKARKVKRVK